MNGACASGWREAGTPVAALNAGVGSRFLYVAEQGSVIRRHGSRLRITKKDAVLLDISALRLESIALYGNVQVTSQCLRELLADGVSLGLFSRTGRYQGRIQGPADRGAALRRRQWARAADTEFSLKFSRAVVRGKLLGAKQVAAAYAKNYLACTLGDAHVLLGQALERLEGAADLDELRGIEGAAARAWFDLFRRCNRSDFEFGTREQRPAPDPINVLLNLGYSMVTRELEGLLEAAGLDPAVGFYHLPHANRPALACDLVEEFRHVLVDRLVLSLVNLGMIRPEHFQDAGERGLRITADGLRIFLGTYERALLGAGPETKFPGGVRMLFLAQIGRLVHAINAGSLYQSHLEDCAATAADADADVAVGGA